MSKGTNSSGRKTSSYGFRRRCTKVGCNKKSEYQIGKSYLCKLHARGVFR